MIGLVRLELTRLRWRRAVLLLVIAAVAIPALIFAVTAYDTRPLSDADLQQARADHSGPILERNIRSCEQDPESAGLADAASCEARVLGQYEQRSQLYLDSELDGALVGVVVIVLLLMLLAGATYAGHDWNSGSMSNQLLVEPRRARVWTAKALAVTILAFALALLVLLAYWYGLVGLASLRGLSQDSGVVGDGLELCLRSVALIAGGALGGFALTMLFRSTVATIGVVVGAAIVGAFLLTVLVDESGRYQLQNNVLAVITGEVDYYTNDPTCDVQDVMTETCYFRQVDAGDGALYLGTLTLLAGGASMLSFRRRDVP